MIFLFCNDPILHMNSTIGQTGQFFVVNKKTPVKGRGQPKCLHNGIILIVICFIYDVKIRLFFGTQNFSIEIIYIFLKKSIKNNL